MTAVLEHATVPVVLTDGHRRRPKRVNPSRVAVMRFAAGTVFALVVVVLAAVVVAHRTADDEAKRNVRRTTVVLGASIIENNLDDALLRGSPQARSDLDRAVRRRLATPTDLRRVKLLTTDGVVVYSDAPQAIGQRFPLTNQELDAVVSSQPAVRTSDRSAPANATERPLGRLLEVSMGVHTPTGRPLLLDAYYSYDSATGRRGSSPGSLLSIGLVALACLLLIQLAIGGVALHWLRQQRRRLQDEADEATDRERSRLASGLHDGLLQDLVGASYAVAIAAGRAEQECRPEIAGLLDPAANTIRASVQGLRSMISAIYPTAVHESGLAVTLHDLVAPARNRGLDVTIDAPLESPLPVAVEAALYRCALEACRNVLAHAQAERLWLQVQVVGHTATLVVGDDGVGFDASAVDTPDHFGLSIMRDLVHDAGGRLEVLTSPGHGTVLTVRLPLHPTGSAVLPALSARP